MILKLRATEWFQLSKRLLINACKNSLHFQKPAVVLLQQEKVRSSAQTLSWR